jgi:hypothetical protein
LLSLSACRTESNRIGETSPAEPVVTDKPDEKATSTPEIVSPAQTPSVVHIGERWHQVLHGRSGQVVMTGMTTDTEISGFLAETWNVETNWFIDGWEDIRAALLYETEQANELHGTSLSMIPRTGFFVTLTDGDVDAPLGRDFDWLFYSVKSSTGETYVFPSEWEFPDSPAPFFDAERSALYVSTSLGIWQITADGVSKKLTADEYDGKHYTWHTTEAYSPNEGWSRLFWISNHIYLNPDKRFIIYTSNRDCYENWTNNMSVWRIDLATGEEQRILDSSAQNIINGFVTNKMLLIDQQFLLDVSNGELIPIELPDLPNRYIEDTGFGYIVCSSYKDEDAGLSTLHIFRVDPESGLLSEVLAQQGVFRGFGFSLSGKVAYANYGENPNHGAETLMLFDFEDMSTRLLEDVLGEAFNELGGIVVRANWLSDNTLLLWVYSFVENRSVYTTWIANW